MPIYTFRNPQGEEIYVKRSIEDRDLPVTAEEEQDKSGPWTRVITQVGKKLGASWGPGKPGTREVMNTIKIKSR